MAQRTRRRKKHSAKKQGNKVKVLAVALATVIFITAVVVFVVNFYENTQDNLEKAAYPLEYTGYVEKYAKENNLETALVYGVIHTESRFNPDAESSVGARGLMQLMPSSFEWLMQIRGEEGKYTLDDLYDPEVNINYGCYLLKYFYDYYGNEQCAVAAYNAGFAVSDWLADGNLSSDGMTLDIIPYPETSEYVDKVESAKQKYIEIYFS